MNDFLATFRKEIIICLLLAAAVFSVYGQVVRYDFAYFDDDKYILENSHVRSGLSLNSIRWAFSAAYEGTWQPMVWLSYMLGCQLTGLHPGVHHLTNVFFHIFNTLLIFFIVRRISGRSTGSGLFAAMFALHPVHVESVAWIAERKDVLSMFFLLLTIWCYLEYVQKSGIRSFFPIILFFSLGLMAKPTLVTLPFALLLLDYWPLDRFSRHPSFPSFSVWKPHQVTITVILTEKIPLLLLTILSVIITILVHRESGALANLSVFPMGLRFANALTSYTGYLGKLVWPFQFAVIYPHPFQIALFRVLGAGIILLLLSFFVLRGIRTYPFLAVGWFWFLGTMFPVIGLVQIGSHAMADRFAYIPFLGIYLILAMGIAHLLRSRRFKHRGLIWMAAAILTCWTCLSWNQTRYWKNSLTLFAHALDVTEDNWIAHYGMGNALARSDQPDQAIRHYLKALEIYPHYELAYYNLGKTFEDKKEFHRALGNYEKALQFSRTKVQSHISIGVVLFKLGRYEEAIEHYAAAIRLAPKSVAAHINLGTTLYFQGKLDEAAVHYTDALAACGDNAELHNNLGLVLLRTGRLAAAVGHFRAALQAQPDFGAARANLKRAGALSTQINTAVTRMRHALQQIDPESTTLSSGFTALHESKQELDQAAHQYRKTLSGSTVRHPRKLAPVDIIQDIRQKYENRLSLFEAIIRMRPAIAEAHYDLACIHARCHQWEKSLVELEAALAKGFANWELIAADTDLEHLRKDSRYKQLYQRYHNRKEKK